MFGRVFLACAIVAGVAASSGCGQGPAPVDTSAVEAKLKAESLVWFEHYANADADGMANLYAEDALLTPPGAPAVKGREGIRTFLGEDAAKSKADGLSLKNGAVTGVGVSGDLGWISGTYTLVDASGATIDSGNYLSIHHLTDGKWLYIRDTWNSDQPPVSPTPDEAEPSQD